MHTQPCSPYLLRLGSADVTLKRSRPGSPRLYALDMTGKRIAELAFTQEGNGIHFHMDNGSGDIPPLAYELVY